MTNHPDYIVRLRPPAGSDGTQELRGALRVLLRRFKLRCVEIRHATPADAAANQQRMHRAAMTDHPERTRA